MTGRDNRGVDEALMVDGRLSWLLPSGLGADAAQSSFISATDGTEPIPSKRGAWVGAGIESHCASISTSVSGEDGAMPTIGCYGGGVMLTAGG